MESNKEKIIELCEEGQRIMLRLLPSDEYGENGDCESLYQGLEEIKELTIKDNLPNDLEVSEWYAENIDRDCSASSAIYKFRLWLKSRSPIKDNVSDGWVSVKDRLPDGDYLVIGVEDNRYFRITFYREDWARGLNITHWQPLPLPPKQ